MLVQVQAVQLLLCGCDLVLQLLQAVHAHHTHRGGSSNGLDHSGKANQVCRCINIFWACRIDKAKNQRLEVSPDVVVAAKLGMFGLSGTLSKLQQRGFAASWQPPTCLVLR